MPVIAPAGVDDVGAGRFAAAGRGLVSDEVREVLLGAPADDKACGACGAVRSAERWPVEVTFDGDRVAYLLQRESPAVHGGGESRKLRGPFHGDGWLDNHFHHTLQAFFTIV